MDDLLEKFAGQRLTSSEVSSISKAFVSKSIKHCKDLAWINVAKNLLKRINKQTDVNLVHNIFIFIEISVKAEVKSCRSASAKLNRKLCPQIIDLLSYIHCLADTDLFPLLSMSELDISSLKATLLAAVIDLQVKGVRSGDENALVTDLYTKLTTMFGNSLEILCDCLLLCRCLVYKNQRKPSVLIPLLRRVILCSASRNDKFRYTSPMHYIKLLLLAKILLFMVETNEVLAVHSLVARTLRVPDFFRDWLDQNNIPWLSQIDRNHINIKNILKCMTVSTVLETIYGIDKVTCETLTDVNHDKHINAPQVEKEELGMRDFLIITKKKNKQTLMDRDKLDGTFSSRCQSKRRRISQLEGQSNGVEVISNKANNENKTSSKTEKKEFLGSSSKKELQNDNVNKERNKRITKSEEKGFEDSVKSNMELNGITTLFTHDSLKWSSPCDRQQLYLQKGLKRSLLKEEIINHRKRVRRDSLTFSVTNFLEENISPIRKEVKRISIQEKGIQSKKVSIGIQTDDCVLNGSEFEADIQSAMTESNKKSVEIDKDCKVLKPKIYSPGSYGKSKMEVTRINNSEEQMSYKIIDVFRMGNSPTHNENNNSPEVNELDYSSSQNINDDSVSDIKVSEEVFNSSSVDKSNMLTGENSTYYERQMEKEKREKEAIVQSIAHVVQRSEESNVRDQMKNLSIIEKEVSNPKRIINKYIKTVKESDRILSKFDSKETKLHIKENKKESLSNNEEESRNEDEMIKIAKIRVNVSENNYHEIIENSSMNTQINSKYKGSELKENTTKVQMTKATEKVDVSESENNRSLKNCLELGRNIAQAEFQIDKLNISEKDTVNTQVNKDYSTLTKDKIDIAENEELEVLSTSGVKCDYGEHDSMGSCVTWSKDTLPTLPQQVSKDTIDMHLQSSSQGSMLSQIHGKTVTDIEITPGIPALKQESHRVCKDHTIGQSVSCNLKNQSQMKVNGTSPRQDLTKNISKENNQNKKQTTDMNDLLSNKMNKTDKKNEKLKVGENYGRINYLVQASQKIFKNDVSISSQLGSLAISFGRRLPQVRLDPLLKREMCKGCGVYLVYGVNAKVRHKSKRQKHLVITCLTCHTIKRFVTNPDHRLWSEQPEAKV